MKRLLLISFCLFLFSGIASGQELDERYLIHDNLIREYLIYIPSNYDANNPAPLVLVLHGFGSNKENMLGVRLNDYAETTGYIVVYPDGIVGPFGSAWNNGMIFNQNIDDMGFLNALIDTISNTYNINDKRIYSTGFSMGGVMSHRLACEDGNRIAAIATVSGPMAMSIRDDCVPERKMPMMHFHGTADDVLAYGGSIITATTGAMNTFHTWGSYNGCEGEVIIEQVPDSAETYFNVEKYTFENCDENYEVIHYRIYNFPHRWPLIGFNINATSEMVRFFERHEMIEESVVLDSPLDIENEMEFLPRPNPFRDYLDISILHERQSVFEWQIFNANGQLISSGTKPDRLDTSYWSSGLYIIRLTFEDQSLTYKLIRE